MTRTCLVFLVATLLLTGCGSRKASHRPAVSKSAGSESTPVALDVSTPSVSEPAKEKPAPSMNRPPKTSTSRKSLRMEPYAVEELREMRLKRRKEERPPLLSGIFGGRENTSLALSPPPEPSALEPLPEPPALRTVLCRLSLAGASPMTLAIPPSSPAQNVDSISVVSSGVPVARVDPVSRMTFVELLPAADDAPRDITLTCRVRRLRVTAPADPDETRRCAASSRLFRDRVPPFALTGAPTDRAAAILRFLADAVLLDENASPLPPDPARALTDKKGSPGDLSALFVQLCRAAGIPARLIVGLKLPPAKTHSFIPAPHLDYRAQFLGVNSLWITLDVTDARRLLPNPESAFMDADPDFLDLAVDPSAADPVSPFLFPADGTSRDIAVRDAD